jgi:hypothetical protein
LTSLSFSLSLSFWPIRVDHTKILQWLLKLIHSLSLSLRQDESVSEIEVCLEASKPTMDRFRRIPHWPPPQISCELGLQHLHDIEMVQLESHGKSAIPPAASRDKLPPGRLLQRLVRFAKGDDAQSELRSFATYGMIGKGARKLESAGNTQTSTGHSLLKTEEEAPLNPHSPLRVSRTRDVSSHGDRPRGPSNHEEEGTSLRLLPLYEHTHIHTHTLTHPVRICP